MSVSSLLGLRTTRIIAIPLSRPRFLGAATTATAVNGTASLSGSSSAPATPSPGGALTYYQFQLTSDDPERVNRLLKRTRTWIPWWLSRLSQKIRTTARRTWVGFGKAEGGWKLKAFQIGERIVDRMDFEELALRTVDPNLSPWPTDFTRIAENEIREEEEVRIPLLYPPSTLTGKVALSELRQHVEGRISVHKRRMYFWMLIAPLTAPFIIIPIVPNFPFIFCVWRSITHWETVTASSYLKVLLSKDCIVPESSEILDAVYKEHAPAFGSTPNHQLLLTKDAIPEIMERFALEPAAKVDLNRAVEQVWERVQSGKVGGSQW